MAQPGEQFIENQAGAWWVHVDEESKAPQRGAARDMQLTMCASTTTKMMWLASAICQDCIGRSRAFHVVLTCCTAEWWYDSMFYA